MAVKKRKLSRPEKKRLTEIHDTIGPCIGLSRRLVADLSAILFDLENEHHRIAIEIGEIKMKKVKP